MRGRGKGFIALKLATVLAVFVLLNSGCDLPIPCSAADVMVTRVDDPAGGSCTATSCSLRQAVTSSNTCRGVQTIHIPNGTYTLSLTGTNEDANRTGDLDIIDSVNILGSGGTVVDGNAADRVFDIQAGATVSMSSLSVKNGYGGFGNNGAGIRNQGVLTATDLSIESNHFTIGGNGGAGLFNRGVASISRSAIVSNFSEEGAGGITSYGDLTLDNVTISGNRGYGLFVADSHTRISFSTIADNYPSQQIWNTGSAGPSPDEVQIDNSILSGTAGDGNCYGPVTSLGFNLDSATPGTERTCALGQPSDLLGMDPLLQSLGDDGGSSPTRALDPASPAIDSADPAHCGGSDQRGVGRPQGTGCDRGAYEAEAPRITLPLPLATLPTPDLLTIDPATPTPGTLLLILAKNANCRKGPGTAYNIITSFEKGMTLQALARNEQNSWAQVAIPSGGSCWVADSTLEKPSTPDGLPVLVAPVLPDAPATLSDKAACEVKLKKMSVKLSWSDVSNESGYHIYRNGKLIATLGANVTTFTEDGLPLDHGQIYEIESFNANGVSERLTTTVSACK
jgi:hypothetical protein